MSRQLPEKPNLEYLRKQAKELLRNTQQSKLADAQHTLAKEYGFATWAELKSHVVTLGLSPAEALRVAVCDSNAHRVRELLESYPELRARIDDPLPGRFERFSRRGQLCRHMPRICSPVTPCWRCCHE